MYIELLVTIQTIFMGIFLYIYMSEKAQQERLIRELSAGLTGKMIGYIDTKLDMNTVAYMREIAANLKPK